MSVPSEMWRSFAKFWMGRFLPNRGSRNTTSMEQKHLNPKSSTNSHQRYRYFSTIAFVRSSPRNECSIFHNHKLREEVVVQATIQLGDKWCNYTVRFIHKRTIEQARLLRPGMKLLLEEGRFEERLGRCDNEFWVKRFSSASGSIGN